MLGTRGKSAKEKPCKTIDTLIGATCEFHGNIVFSGGLRIEGKVKGNITAQGGADSILILTEQSEIHGTVVAPHVIINGKVDGDIHCSQTIDLKPKAEIVGDLHYKLIAVAQGAVVRGNLISETSEDTGKTEVTRTQGGAAPGNER